MKYNSFHFIGIGGIGMSGIAKILLAQGMRVMGSDVARSAQVETLESMGATVKIGHSANNINGADAVIVSSAISINNPEVKTAIRRGIPILHRSEMLAMLMRQKKGVAIAGTHGKTTTTSMVSLILERAQMDPTVIIGGELEQFHSNAKMGQGDWLVAEADESDGSLVRLSPQMAVITNIEADHMDYYSDITDIRNTFEKFISKLPEDGVAVMCTDDQNVKMISKQFHGKKLTYGLSNGALLKAVKMQFSEMGSQFTVINRGLEIGSFRLNVPGMHNVYNCLAAISVGLEMGIDMETMHDALLEFKGAKRRFQVISNGSSMTVVDDYAHHPTEIMATLSAARKIHGGGRIISVFQPHRYSRTKYFFDLYGQSFFNSDHVIVTDIYAAGEKPIPKISGEMIAASLKKYGHQEVTYIPNIQDVPSHLMKMANDDDFVITLGAGDVWKVARQLSDSLNSLKSA